MNKIMNKKLKESRAGFTLLEMLLVIAIIAILAGIVIIAINPGRQLAQTRNAQRASDLRAIHSAVQQFYIDNRDWPADLETVTTLEEICDTGAATTGHGIDCTTEGLIDLSMLVPTYISAIPSDPQGPIASLIPFIKTAHAQTAGVGAGYEIAVNENQMVVLNAPKSDEYGLNTVSLGDVASVTVTGCNDPALTECWSAISPTTRAWSIENITTGVSTDTTLDNGKENTDILLSLEGSYPAAEYCQTLNNENHGGFNDWYLPSLNQLTAGLTAQFITSPATVAGFVDVAGYWSSTEDSSSFAWRAGHYNDGVGTSVDFKDGGYSVRCLR